jgi:hypothetical protein
MTVVTVLVDISLSGLNLLGRDKSRNRYNGLNRVAATGQNRQPHR